MDDKALLRVESTLTQIKNKILGDSELRKLLYFSSDEVKVNIEQMKEPSRSAVEDNVYLQLIIDLDTTPPFNKRNFIALRINSASANDGEMSYLFNFTIASEKHDWLVNGHIRPLLICQRIINLIDGEKFDLSGPMYFVRLSEQVLNDDVTGYAMIFGATDGTYSIA